LIFDFFTFLTRVPLRIVVCLSTKGKSKSKMFDPVTASKLVPKFWAIHYVRVQNKFVHNVNFGVSKDAEFYVDFKNVNLPK
jgi:hypothetical protein